MVALLIATHFWYPQGAALARWDFLFLAALGVQAILLALKLETLEEGKGDLCLSRGRHLDGGFQDLGRIVDLS